MHLEMQNFDFVQISSNLPKFNYFCPNFALILLKFCPILVNFAQKIFARDAAASPALTALYVHVVVKPKRTVFRKKINF